MFRLVDTTYGLLRLDVSHSHFYFYQAKKIFLPECKTKLVKHEEASLLNTSKSLDISCVLCLPNKCPKMFIL